MKKRIILEKDATPVGDFYAESRVMEFIAQNEKLDWFTSTFLVFDVFRALIKEKAISLDDYEFLVSIDGEIFDIGVDEDGRIRNWYNKEMDIKSYLLMRII